MKERILLVGCGNMGKAMLEAFLEAGHNVAVVEQNDERCRSLQAQGVQAYKDNLVLGDSEFTKNADDMLVIYAIKPQNSEGVLRSYGHWANSDLLREVVHVSIMAGIELATIAAWLGGGDKIVVRTMPNLPIAIKRGTMVSVGNSLVSAGLRSRLDKLFSNCGESLWLQDEHLMHAVTALSGSGSGYVFHYMEEMVKAGENLGLDKDLSLNLVLSFVSGASEMALQRNRDKVSLTDLRENVTSKGGTMAAAFEVLNHPECGVGRILREATLAAKKRSMYLGGEEK